MAHTLDATEHDIGNLIVKRVLPQRAKRMIGPFIFFDHMGPGSFPAGKGINVRPHPHIGLCTLTYLFDGAILHRDSLGNALEITPGDVNWMTAGRGITHSERESFEVKARDHSVNGLQCWIALPKDKSEIEPSFTHIKKEDLPTYIHEGVSKRLIAGDAYGMTSPIRTHSPMFYVDVMASEGSVIDRPNAQETAVYPVYGSITVDGVAYGPGDFVVLEDTDKEITATEDSRFIILGGEEWEEIPFIEWNFVAFTKERLAQAREDWRAGKFPTVPGDDKEYIPY